MADGEPPRAIDLLEVKLDALLVAVKPSATVTLDREDFVAATGRHVELIRP